jgi:DNA-binding LytR/AlgR family response regulator
MKKIRCLLVDDENLALEVVQLYCDKIAFIEVVGTAKNADEASSFIQNNQVDVVFLDIQMPKVSGMEWYKHLVTKPLVIFCTAFQHFAVESYEVEAIDYLLKPFSFERFAKAAEKAKEAFDSQATQTLVEESIFIRSDRKEIRVMISDILYIQSISNYFEVVTQEKKIIGYGSISTLESKLKDFNFIRIHRSFLVSKNKITIFSSNAVTVGSCEIPIGRNYRKNIQEIHQQSAAI